MEKRKGVHSILLQQANNSWSDIAPVKYMLNRMEANSPHEITVLLKGFDLVCQDLQKLRSQPLDPNYYSHVIQLNEKLGDKPVVTLKEAVRDSASCPQTFVDIHDKIVSEEWEFPTNPWLSYRTRVSGLLIEGYGVNLACRYNNPKLAEEFVLAFEEVMFTRHPRINLLTDVLEWMIVDRDKFSLEVKADLEILSELPTTLGEQLQQLPVSDEERLKLTENLFHEFKKLFKGKGLSIINSGFRVKDRDAIFKKGRNISRGKRRDTPIGDIFGTRFVMREEDIPQAADAIKSNWRIPPVLRNGFRTDRESSGKESFNENSDPSYRARHLNIIFQDEKGQHQIGEVQLFTPKHAEIAKKTRKKYLSKRGR